MKKFILNFLAFLLMIIIIIGIVIMLPATPREKTSLLFAKIDKDGLLKNTPSPRIIFIGGSNLSFGLNSQIIKDSLGYNPVNTAVHASIGLFYMLDNTLPFIKHGDVVIIVPEYSQYYNRSAYGGEELLRTALDVPGKGGITTLTSNQVYNTFPYILKYFFSKIKTSEYSGFDPDPIYSRNSFDKYGDAVGHWGMPASKVTPEVLKGSINYAIFYKLKNYQEILKKIGVPMYISFPGYQATSFKSSLSYINKADQLLIKNGFNILGTPKRYEIPDTLMFNTPYHLTKKAADERTTLLMQDLKKKHIYQ